MARRAGNGYNRAMRAGYSTPLLIVVWGFAVGVLLWGSGVDVALQRWLWAHYNQQVNDVMHLIGDIGKGTTLVVVCVALAGYMAGMERLRGGAWRLERKVCMLLATVPVVALAGAVNFALKWVVGRPRPKEMLMYGGDPWANRPFQGDAVWWSFPSGHSCSALALTVWLGCAFPRWRWPLLAAGVMVALSRFMAITPHYTGDAAAGGSLGAAIALALWQWQKERWHG